MLISLVRLPPHRQKRNGIDDIPEAFINIIKLHEGIFVHAVENLDNVGCDARVFFSRIALKGHLDLS